MISELKRGSGRTSRMLEEISLCKDREIDVYAAGAVMVETLKRNYELQYGPAPHVEWISCTSSPFNRDNFLSLVDRKAFIDHSCIECYYAEILNLWCEYDTTSETKTTESFVDPYLQTR